MSTIFVQSLLFSVLFLAGTATIPAADPPVPKPVELWSGPGSVPGATGTADEDKPAVFPYLPDPAVRTGAAILVCPGGGFTTRCADFEGVLIARWLQDHGIAAFILRYRIRPLYTMKESVQDANRAMQFLRSRAKEYGIAQDRIGAIGFSAGAELAAAATFAPLAGSADSTDPVDRFPSRPNFLVLAYGSSPLGGRGGANSTAGTGSAPPTFMFCTGEDASHIAGMTDLYTALRRARVPVEAHFFAHGEHGVGFAQGDPVLGEWPSLMYRWVRAGGFLTDKKRIAVSGSVTIDGELLVRGSVTLTPLNAVGDPSVTGYVMNTGKGAGVFALGADQGPVPGKYRVEVRQDASRWLSNSVNPMVLKMTQKQRAGTLTDADRKEWQEYARARDLSPSLEGQRVYHKTRPADKDDLVVEIKADGATAVDIKVYSK
jgi:acetyl esterase/lipase